MLMTSLVGGHAFLIGRNLFQHLALIIQRQMHRGCAAEVSVGEMSHLPLR